MKRSRYIAVRFRRRARRRAAGTCQIRWSTCSREDQLEYHHRHMFAEGGTHRAVNLVLACRPCHEAIHWGDQRLAAEDGLLLGRNPRRRWLAYWEK